MLLRIQILQIWPFVIGCVVLEVAEDDDEASIFKCKEFKILQLLNINVKDKTDNTESRPRKL
jgi:hypothetical protein